MRKSAEGSSTKTKMMKMSRFQAMMNQRDRQPLERRLQTKRRLKSKRTGKEGSKEINGKLLLFLVIWTPRKPQSEPNIYREFKYTQTLNSMRSLRPQSHNQQTRHQIFPVLISTTLSRKCQVLYLSSHFEIQAKLLMTFRWQDKCLQQRYLTHSSSWKNLLEIN